ncbi:hypothetical protein WJX77_003512 [Trebouxia sp. C0004]
MDSISGPPAPSGDLSSEHALTGGTPGAPLYQWTLVYVWATTARASPKLLEYACQQQDLIVVHHDVIMRMCPLLAIAPELYSARPLAPLNPRLQVKKGHIMHHLLTMLGAHNNTLYRDMSRSILTHL